MNRLVLFSILLSCLPNGRAFAQQNDIPWPVMLGRRVAVAESNRPIAPIVVLVPDVATYLREVGKWTPEAQWPVLIEDTELAPMFIRAFKPKHVLRVPAAPPLPTDSTEREELMRSAVTRSWGGAEGETPEDAFEKFRWKPPGVAVTNASDPAWPAAVAIAAARGLPLAFLSEEYGRPGAILDSQRTRQLQLNLEDLVSKTGYRWRDLGDDIDAVAICRSLAARTKLEPEGTARNPYADRMKGPYALLDSICRHQDGTRWAVAGWIWGNEIRSAYMAMSSIFLPRNNVWFFNGYGTSTKRKPYEVAAAAAEGTEFGFQTAVFDGKQGTLDAWLGMVMGGLNADVLFASSSGRPEFFDLAENTRGHAVDIPILQKPLALQFIHSFSLQRPMSTNTVGGRFLDHGVYSYIGSVEEPYLGAFIPPALYMKRIMHFVPFLIAGRTWAGSFSTIWRLTAIGDPLMLVQPVSRRKIKVAEFPVIPDAEDVQSIAQEQMIGLKENQDGTREVIESLVLIGRDKLAAQVWKTMCGEQNLTIATDAAPAALGPLFRTREFNEFVRAYDRLPPEAQTTQARDMLWHLAALRLSSLNDPDQIMLLATSLRGPDVSVDLARLMPHLDRLLGPGAGRAAVQRELESTNSEEYRAALMKLME